MLLKPMDKMRYHLARTILSSQNINTQTYTICIVREVIYLQGSSDRLNKIM